MNKTVRFPIRVKILVALLFVVTAVVGTITFTMATLFHEDKTAYIHDLVSTVVNSTADECNSILTGYAQRLQVYGRIMTDAELSQEARGSLLTGFFEDFPELVALTARRGDEEIAAAYNNRLLEAAGLSREDLVEEARLHPPPPDRLVGGEISVANSSLSPSLPTLTLAEAPVHEAGAGIVISAVIRLDTLLRVASRPGPFELFLVDPQGIVLAHPNRDLVTRRQRLDVHAELLEAVRGTLSASMTREYTANGVEVIGGFAGLGQGGLVAGAQVPRTAAYLASREVLGRLMYTALGLLVCSTVFGLFWAHRVTRPVVRLSEATREIAKGDFDISVAVNSRDEIGALAGSFNQMASELKNRDAALQEAQAQLVQSEKLAAFGQLGAGIAHEVKNPLAGILGCAQLALRKAEKNTPIEQNLRLIEKETRRCKEIIENLLKFARQEPAALQPISVNPVVDDAVAIMRHQLEMAKIQVETTLAPDVPMIHGNANQLQQVLMNLMLNAQQAMEDAPGSVRVSTSINDEGQVEIRVADTGPGMSEQVKARLFEPFFTTKPNGKGTGLGLSVSFGIIKDHRGEIEVDSEPGHGATFIISMPALVEHAPADGGAARRA